MMKMITKYLSVMTLSILALLAGTTLCAQIATYKVTAEAKQKVTIDGKLQEECWQGQPMISQFQQYRRDPEAVVPATSVWMAKEKDALLIAVECMEPEMANLQLTAKHHDDKTWMDDSIELFFNPAGDRQSHVQIVINADGVIMDGISDYLGAPLDMSWDSGMEAEKLGPTGGHSDSAHRIGRRYNGRKDAGGATTSGNDSGVGLVFGKH